MSWATYTDSRPRTRSERGGDDAAKERAEAVTGTGAAVMGNPVTSVGWLAKKLTEFGVQLKAGEVILPGSIGKAIDVRAGDFIEAEFGRLGSVSVRFE